MIEANTITRRFQLLAGMVDERTRRLVAAAEALSIGRGGSATVARATGISRRAIQQGIKELLEDVGPGAGRVRRVGGGRKKTVFKDPSLRDDLERMMAPANQGKRESPLRWTYKSVRQLTEELKQMGHQTSHRMVAELLHELGYNLKVNRQTKDYADWDAQVEFINRKAQAHFAVCDPVISLEARKKEWRGEFRNGGRALSPLDTMEKRWVPDFLVTGLGQVTPNHAYKPDQDHASVDFNVDHDIETFTVENIQRWWMATGRTVYAQARRLLLITDGNSHNVFRTHLWKLEVQKLADATGLAVTVCHLPPGTSKWNKIEYQFCAYVMQSWRGQSLISYAVNIQLIAPTMTRGEITGQRHLDAYPTEESRSDAEWASILLPQDTSDGEWNYTILPHCVSQ